MHSFQYFLKLSRNNKTKFKRKPRNQTRIHPITVDHNQSIANPQHSTSYAAEILGSNQDLINTILSKLKSKHRARMSLVCKSWYRWITSRRFVYKLPPPSDLLIQRYTARSRVRQFPNIKYLTVPLKNQGPTPATSQPFLDFLQSGDRHRNGIRISQSCNGLFLCPANVSNSRRTNANVEHYVYNPTTGQSRLIPLPSKKSTRHVTAMNLAFDPNKSRGYKIVCLSKVHKTYFSYNRVDIYSSETSSWHLSKAEFPQNCFHIDFSNSVFLKGAIHWPSYKGDTVYFRVEKEYFKIMPMPPLEEGQSRRSIRFFGEAGGRLLLIDFNKPSPMSFDIFEMSSNHSNWVVKYKVQFLYRRIVQNYQILSVVSEGEGDNLSLVIYSPGRDRSHKGIMTYSLKNTYKVIQKVHSPVPLWDLRLLRKKGPSVVHPLIRTTFEV